jgi:O-antigen ligase
MSAISQAVAATPVAPRRQAVLPVACGTTACLLPILKPAGPGNTAAADLGIVVCIVCALMWSVRERIPFRFPYAAGVLLMMVGGALAAAVAQAPLSTVLPLVQDLLLLLWAATLALGHHDPAIIRATTHAWCRMVPVYCAVMVLSYIIGLSALSGVNAKDGARASYTFADPNLAGNYLVVSMFVMAACQRPRSPGIRRVSYLVVLVAIAFTGSNGAMLTLLVGSVLAFSLLTFRARGALAGLMVLSATTAIAAFGVTVVLPRVDMEAVREQAASSVPLLRDSIGRSGGSTSERQTILVEGSQLYLDGNALGIGPALTKSTLQETQAPYVKEAHNDYLATLLERGVVGTAGLVVLGFAIGMRSVRVAVGPVPESLRDAVPRAWLLAVLFPVMVVAATFYEVLHFRHLWTCLGVLAAVVLAIREERVDDRAPTVPVDLVRVGGGTR